MVFRSNLGSVGIRQNTRAELIALRVDVSAVSGAGFSTDGLDEGSNYATIEKDQTGIYDIQLNRVPRRLPVVLGAVAVGENFVRLNAQFTENGLLRVYIEADDGANTDADFHITFLVFYSNKER